MRGRVNAQPTMFSYVDLEDRIPANHPLRRIKLLADKALLLMDRELTVIYKPLGRASIPPEQLLKASILQIIYGIRSERQLVEQIEFSMLYRWFLDLGLDEKVWVPTVYSHNRDRLLVTEIARRFLHEIVEQARSRGFVSSDHFSVDGTLIHAWASIKSYEAMPMSGGEEPPPDNPPSDRDPPLDEDGHQLATTAQEAEKTSADVVKEKPDLRPKGKDVLRNFRGERFSNHTHRSRTDADARLARKSNSVAARPSYLGNALMENRCGLVLQGEIRLASEDGGETGAAIAMLDRKKGDHSVTLGADKGYDSKEFIEALSTMSTIPHVAQNKSARRKSSVPDEVVATPGYAVSIRVRKRIEQVFGWVKQSAGLRQIKIRGKAAVDGLFQLALSAYNLVRMSRLMAVQA